MLNPCGDEAGQMGSKFYPLESTQRTMPQGGNINMSQVRNVNRRKKNVNMSMNINLIQI